MNVPLYIPLALGLGGGVLAGGDAGFGAAGSLWNSGASDAGGPFGVGELPATSLLGGSSTFSQLPAEELPAGCAGVSAGSCCGGLPAKMFNL